MLNKYATATIEKVYTPSKKTSKTSAMEALGAYELPGNLEFSPDFVYSQCRALSARINHNLDGFTREEILGEVEDLPPHNEKFGYRTFIGKYNHIDHHNQPHLGEMNPLYIPRGIILGAWYHEDPQEEEVKLKGLVDPIAKMAGKDCWVRLLIANSRKVWPKLCSAIEDGSLTKVSMGAEVAGSHCAVCGNHARHEWEYCACVSIHRGSILTAKANSPYVKNGILSEGDPVIAHEINHGLQFFEESWITDEQADPTAVLLDIIKNEKPVGGKEDLKAAGIRLGVGITPSSEPTTNDYYEEGAEREPIKDMGAPGSSHGEEEEDRFDYSAPPNMQPGEHEPEFPFPCSALYSAKQANPDYPLETVINIEKCLGCMYNKSDKIGSVDCTFPKVVRESGADPLPPGFSPPEDAATQYQPSGFKNEDGTEIKIMPGLTPRNSGRINSDYDSRVYSEEREE